MTRPRREVLSPRRTACSLAARECEPEARAREALPVAARQIGTRDVCASIPHREAMLLFARGDRACRDAMRAVVREKESDGRKPLTFELFLLTDRGPEPLATTEPAP